MLLLWCLLSMFRSQSMNVCKGVYMWNYLCFVCTLSSLKSKYHDKCEMVGACCTQLGVGRWTYNQHSSWYSSHYDGVSKRIRVYNTQYVTRKWSRICHDVWLKKKETFISRSRKLITYVGLGDSGPLSNIVIFLRCKSHHFQSIIFQNLHPQL